MNGPASTLGPNEYLDWMCVNVHKEEETTTSCTYSFSCMRYRDGEPKGRAKAIGPVFGRISIQKVDGELKLVEPMPGDQEKRVASRAAQAIVRHWRRGEYPANTGHFAG